MRTDKSINELLLEFAADQDVCANSVRQYAANLRQWFNYCQKFEIDVRKPRRADIIAYKSYLVTSYTITTANNYLSAVKLFYSWVETRGYYENVSATIKLPRKGIQSRKGFLDKEQVMRLLNSIPRQTLAEMRDFAIINTMLRTGFRCIEIRRMNIEDIFEADGEYKVQLQRKGRQSKGEVLGLTEKIIEPIHEYLACRESATESLPMFVNHSRNKNGSRLTTTSISRIIKNKLKAIGLTNKRLTAHSLRHTAAITALRGGASVHEIQKMLGHHDATTTEVYLSSISDMTKYNNPAVHAIDILL